MLVVFIAGLPYVILNMSEGVHDVSKELRDMAAAYEVPRDRVMRHLILPSLSPFFFASLRYGLANGWKGLILAEVFAATSGAGWHITSMRNYGDFAGVVGFARLLRAVLDRCRAAGVRAALPPGVPLASGARARDGRNRRS